MKHNMEIHKIGVKKILQKLLQLILYNNVEIL
jgi:hypothetical protein